MSRVQVEDEARLSHLLQFGIFFERGKQTNSKGGVCISVSYSSVFWRENGWTTNVWLPLDEFASDIWLSSLGLSYVTVPTRALLLTKWRAWITARNTKICLPGRTKQNNKELNNWLDRNIYNLNNQTTHSPPQLLTRLASGPAPRPSWKLSWLGHPDMAAVCHQLGMFGVGDDMASPSPAASARPRWRASAPWWGRRAARRSSRCHCCPSAAPCGAANTEAAAGLPALSKVCSLGSFFHKRFWSWSSGCGISSSLRLF